MKEHSIKNHHDPYLKIKGNKALLYTSSEGTEKSYFFLFLLLFVVIIVSVIVTGSVKTIIITIIILILLLFLLAGFLLRGVFRDEPEEFIRKIIFYKDLKNHILEVEIWKKKRNEWKLKDEYNLSNKTIFGFSSIRIYTFSGKSFISLSIANKQDLKISLTSSLDEKHVYKWIKKLNSWLTDKNLSK